MKILATKTSAANRAAIIMMLAAALLIVGAKAPRAQDSGFPFGMELRLDANPMPGSKRVPSLEIGANGEVVLELWCKGGRGQFSVANDTVIFIAGPMPERACPPERATADEALLRALGEATNWTRQGDILTFKGARALRFRVNTN